MRRVGATTPTGPPAARQRRRDDRRVNLTLGVCVALSVVTGLAANTQGTTAGRWLVVVHGVLGLALIVLGPAKGRIARRSLSRRRRRRGWRLSVVLSVLAVTTVASGLASSTGMVRTVGPLTVMQLHIGSAVLVLVLGGVHYVQRPLWSRLRSRGRRGARGARGTTTAPGSVGPASPTRRDLLRTGVVAGIASLTWAGWERLLDGTGAPGGERRFTGSHERSSGDPTGMPVTQWLDDRVQDVDPASWRLTTPTRTWDLAALRTLPQDDVTAVLDCTSLWWSEQSWRGVRLDRLVDPGDAASIAVTSRTGYGVRLPADELDRLWIALEVGGAPLSAGHGAPARLVAPGRRGFWWVKWVVRIEPSSVPWWVQSPFPLT